MNLENKNQETIENHAVEYLLQMGFFNHKLCNNKKNVSVQLLIKLTTSFYLNQKDLINSNKKEVALKKLQY